MCKTVLKFIVLSNVSHDGPFYQVAQYKPNHMAQYSWYAPSAYREIGPFVGLSCDTTVYLSGTNYGN